VGQSKILSSKHYADQGEEENKDEQGECGVRRRERERWRQELSLTRSNYLIEIVADNNRLRVEETLGPQERLLTTGPSSSES